MYVIIRRSDVIIYMIYAWFFKIYPLPESIVSFNYTLVEYVLELDASSVLLVLYSIALFGIIDTISVIPSMLRLIYFRCVILNGSFAFSLLNLSTPWLLFIFSEFFSLSLVIYRWSTDPRI